MLEIYGIDPRSASPEKLKPTHPLPYVSRKALGRVKERLLPPSACNCCGQDAVELVSNSETYNGTEYGEWPYVYLCRGCGARVGLHKNTDLPLGTLADSETRSARKRVKDKFLAWAASSGLSRDKQYETLAQAMGIEQRTCHFGMLNLAQVTAAEVAVSTLSRQKWGRR